MSNFSGFQTGFRNFKNSINLTLQASFLRMKSYFNSLRQTLIQTFMQTAIILAILGSFGKTYMDSKFQKSLEEFKHALEKDKTYEERRFASANVAFQAFNRLDIEMAKLFVLLDQPDKINKETLHERITSITAKLEDLDRVSLDIINRDDDFENITVVIENAVKSIIDNINDLRDRKPALENLNKSIKNYKNLRITIRKKFQNHFRVQ